MDNIGRPLSGVVASVVLADTPSPEAQGRSASVGKDGWATFDIPAGHYYLVSVGYVGFEPRSGILFVDLGCTLELHVTLAVANPKDTI
jgi:hypothetical protein